MASLSFSCIYCGPSQKVGPQVTWESSTATVVEWRQWWKVNGPLQNADMLCAMCSAQHGFEDDGVSSSQGGAIQVRNTSRPKITSLGTASGPAAGGTTVTINGDFLEVGALVVKFDGVAATNLQNLTKTSVDVDTPAGAGVVDVTVENEHGQRADGSSLLAGSFTYT